MGQQDRDLPIPTIPRNAAEFAAGLRALRVGSLRHLEKIQKAAGEPDPIPRSTLSRYENGDSLPPLEYHARLDALYGGTGWVSLAVRSLRRGGWDPWADDDGFRARSHAGLWPAEYQGDVWVKVKPASMVETLPHRFSLSWGPHRCEVSCLLGRDGVLFVTGKGRDEVAVPLNLTCDREVFVLFGAGDRVEGDEVIDIRHDWT